MLQVKQVEASEQVTQPGIAEAQVAQLLVPSTKKPLEQEVHVLASEQVRQSLMTEQASQVLALRKKPLEQDVQVAESEHPAQLGRVVLQASQVLVPVTKNPALQLVQVEGSVHTPQLGEHAAQALAPST